MLSTSLIFWDRLSAVFGCIIKRIEIFANGESRSKIKFLFIKKKKKKKLLYLKKESKDFLFFFKKVKIYV